MVCRAILSVVQTRALFRRPYNTTRNLVSVAALLPTLRRRHDNTSVLARSLCRLVGKKLSENYMLPKDVQHRVRVKELRRNISYPQIDVQ